MKLNHLYFHIHYCNSRQRNGGEKYPRASGRKMQHHEIALITGGKGRMIIGGKRHPYKEGTLFYIGQDMPHALEPEADTSTEFLSVHFSYGHVRYYEGKWSIRNEEQMLSLPTVSEPADSYHLEELFRMLVVSWHQKRPGYEFISRTYLHQLLLIMLQDKNRHEHNYAVALKVEKVIQYLHDNVGKRVSLAELAELVQVAPTYLARIFKETTGYTVITFFNKMKTDKAKEMMIDNNIKMKEVAQALGYSDEFYFSRLFKKIEGISPSEYYSKIVHGI